MFVVRKCFFIRSYSCFIGWVCALCLVKIGLDVLLFGDYLQVTLQSAVRDLPVLEVTSHLRKKVYFNVTFPPFVEHGKPGDPGEMGESYHFKDYRNLSKAVLRRRFEGSNKHNFNEYVSEEISLHRSLPDPRGEYCRNQDYSGLNPVSVVIVFYDEAWTTLLRSIHSIIDRTPARLLKEIILLDDYSTMDHLKEPLEAYLQNLEKVRLLRAKHRLGLIQARNLAFQFVTSNIVVFLDSHVECNTGWLEPLIAPLHRDSKVITFPIIDSIDYFTFKYQIVRSVVVGGFDYQTLLYKWLFDKQFNLSADHMETASPTMPGGLFAVTRDWFKTLGQFDLGLKIWGAENLELSFKTWMCGGGLLLTSCSRVGHVFRRANPNVHSNIDFLRNVFRLAEVWMDEYKHYFYETRGHNIIMNLCHGILGDCVTNTMHRRLYLTPTKIRHPSETSYGDVSDRVKLRKSLNCNSFAWYVENVYPDLKKELPAHDELYYGLIKNEKFNLCVERFTDHILDTCNDVEFNQIWAVIGDGVVYIDNVYLAADQRNKNAANKTLVALKLASRPEKVEEGNSWQYNKADKLLIHKNTGLCLEVDPSTNVIVINACQVGSSQQSWVLTTRRERMDLLRYKVTLQSAVRDLPVLEVTSHFRKKVYSNVTFPPFVEYGKPGDPGEMGESYHFKDYRNLSKAVLRRRFEGSKKHGFNEYVSEEIALHRSLPDPRGDYCRKQDYSGLNPVSVVIVFYDETWTTLLRSIHSIIDRTPARLLKEIILLDDYSTMDHLKEPLEAYLQNLEKVRLLRAEHRLGLIQARSLAFQFVTSSIAVFLDSHVECNTGWLGPLIAPLHRDYKVITFPIIDTIDYMSFKYKTVPYSVVGGFDYQTLIFKWLLDTKHNLTADNMEIASPTMPGGLFAVTRDWFKTLGQFDPGLKIWGAENLELSFKTWMCGGSLLLTSCSRVGHVFRKDNPNVRSYSEILDNHFRLAEVWMDEYKHYFYETRAHNITFYGDVSDRVKLRKSLNCHSFTWYVENIYPDLKKELPAHDEMYYGLIKNEKFNLCVERFTDHILNTCNDHEINQIWAMFGDGLVYTDDIYIAPNLRYTNAANKTIVGLKIALRPEKVEGGSSWQYNKADKLLIHKNTGQCLEVDPSTNVIVINACQVGSSQQSWVLTTRRERMDLLRYKLHIPISWD